MSTYASSYSHTDTLEMSRSTRRKFKTAAAGTFVAAVALFGFGLSPLAHVSVEPAYSGYLGATVASAEDGIAIVDVVDATGNVIVDSDGERVRVEVNTFRASASGEVLVYPGTGSRNAKYGISDHYRPAAPLVAATVLAMVALVLVALAKS